jgi:hypothetical protein
MSNDVLSLSAASLQRVIKIKRKMERLEEQLAKLLGGSSSAATSSPDGRKRRKMSPEGRKRIAAAAKARWARYHAEQKK